MDCLPDFFRSTSHERTGADRSQDILHVMRALEGDVRYRQHVPLFLGITKDDHAVANPRAQRNFLLTAKPEYLRPSPRSQSRTGRIVQIEHREVAGLLVLEDARLGVDVGVERAMAVEMVRRDIEHDRNFGPKGLDGLQLKA